MNFKYSYLTVVLWMCIIQVAQGQKKLENDSITFDENIRYGILPNGFTYYIKPLAEPHSEVEFKLWVKAGGLQEDPDQLDMAHDVEHMAFKASNHFPRGLTNEKERIKKMGMRNLRDFGAITAPNYTEYFFNAPKGNQAALETCLLWFGDIADGLKLTTEDIDSERGVWRQEFIFREGNDPEKFYTKTKLRSLIIPCLTQSGNFLKHNEKFSPAVLRRFYKNWYRPDLMGMSICGNIADVDGMENKIKEAFSGIKAPVKQRKTKDCSSLYLEQPPQFALVHTEQASLHGNSENKVECFLAYRDPKMKQTINTMEGVKRKITWQLLRDALQDRFWEMKNIYSPGFDIFSKYISHSSAIFTYEAYNVKVTSENGNIKEILKKVVRCLHQMKEYGALPSEWKDVKGKRLSYLKNRNTLGSSYWTEEIKHHFMWDEPLPNDKRQKLIQWLENLSLEEFNKEIAGFIKTMPEDIGIISPKGNNPLINEKTVRTSIQKAWEIPVQPCVLPQIAKTLMSVDELAALKENSIVTDRIGKNGAREVGLRNGVKLVLLKDTLTENKITLYGFSPYGTSCVKPKDYYSAINAANIVTNAGVGRLNKFELDRFISNTGFSVKVQPYLKFHESGIKGEASGKGLETMLQLTYKYLTQPRKDKRAFEDWKSQKIKEYQDPPYGEASFNFHNEIKKIMGNKNYTNAGEKLWEGVQKTTLEKAYESYVKLMGDAKTFTFLIRGDFNENSIEPLLKKYLGNLPNTSKKLNCYSSIGQIETPLKKPLFKNIKTSKSKIKNSNYMMKFIPDTKEILNWKEKLNVELLGIVLGDKALALRYKEGFSLYDVMGSGNYNSDLGKYEVSLEFAGEYKEMQHIRTRIKKILKEIKKGDFNEEMVEKGKIFLTKIYSSKGYKEKHLVDYYKNNTPWISQKQIDNYIASITGREIKETAKKYIKKDYRYEFVTGN